jgi:hypothetical protein
MEQQGGAAVLRRLDSVVERDTPVELFGRGGELAEEQQRRAQGALSQGAAERLPLLRPECDQPLGEVAGPLQFAARGEARNECARVAAACVDPKALIIFDNSNRRAFRDGVAHLVAQGWRRIDFYGLIPSYLYKNCTSVFFKSDHLLTRADLPSDAVSCLGPTCSQTLGQ